MERTGHWVVVGSVALACLACKKEPSKLDILIESAKPVEAPPPAPKDFAFPAMSTLTPKQILPVVYQASKEPVPGQDAKIDAWLRDFKLPVQVRGPTKKFASDFEPMVCHYRDRTLLCVIAGKIAEASKFIVTSNLTCLNDKGEEIKKMDWEAPGKSKRGAKGDLEVPEKFLEPCLTEGGVKLGVEVLGSPCAIPFPHQVRCAGEYNTCRQTCKGVEACDQRCEANRLDCLKVCKK